MRDLSSTKKTMYIINLAQLTGTDTLAGKSAALGDLPKLLNEIDKTPEHATIVLGFEGVELVTASYLGATIVVLLRMAVSGELDRFYVVSGLNRNCLDELKMVMEYQQLAVLVAGSMRAGMPKDVSVLGKLDPTHLQTFETVSRVNGATATQLYESGKRSSAKVGQTAWINRLNALYQARLVRKRKIGREFVFQAVHQEQEPYGHGLGS